MSDITSSSCGEGRSPKLWQEFEEEETKNFRTKAFFFLTDRLWTVESTNRGSMKMTRALGCSFKRTARQHGYCTETRTPPFICTLRGLCSPSIRFWAMCIQKNPSPGWQPLSCLQIARCTHRPFKCICTCDRSPGQGGAKTPVSCHWTEYNPSKP